MMTAFPGNLIMLATAAAGACSSGAWTQPNADGSPLLSLDGSIALPGVAGRIDHLAYDPHGRRLFVAELGNGTVEAIDLASGRVTKREDRRSHRAAGCRLA